MERAGGTSDSGIGNDAIPLEVLEHRLTSRAAELAAAEAEWMAWLAEYDRRQGWAEWGCLGPAHWLSWKCGMSPSAARERVRVATALTELALIRDEFAAGRLSYSKVQAMTRVANDFNQADLVELAAHATGAQMSRICAGYRASEVTSDEAAETALLCRQFSTRCHHDGTSSVTLRIPDADLTQIKAHLERACADLIDDALVDAQAASAQGRANRRDIIAERGGIGAVRADAAIALLTGESLRTEPTPVDVMVVVGGADVHDCDDTCAQASDENPPAAQGQAAPGGDTGATHACAQVSCDDGPGGFEVLVDHQTVARPVGRRLLCDPRIHALIESADAGPLAVGRSTRIINRRLRLALERRDRGCCQFPGCSATRRLHAHHIVHWAEGGPTELDNLILVCHFHHHLVHEGRWSINGMSRQFRRPDGTPVDPTPEHLRAGVGTIEPSTWRGEGAGPLEPPNMSPFDLPWTTAVLHHNESIRRGAANQATGHIDDPLDA